MNNQILMNRLKASTSVQPNISTHSLNNPIPDKKDFMSNLQSSISNLEQKQINSDQAIEGLINGEADNLHQVMIQTTEAQLSLELAVQVRNKAIEAMNEIKNMQF